MKNTDIALVILIAAVSIGLSYWLGNLLLGDPSDDTYQISYVEGVSAEIMQPDIETFKGAKTQGGKDAMSRNGRAWTEGFVIKVTKDGKSKNITFDIVTNEGGALYGYCIGYEVVNLKKFKEILEREFNNI